VQGAVVSVRHPLEEMLAARRGSVRAVVCREAAP
jgi:hypothetical protein